MLYYITTPSGINQVKIGERLIFPFQYDILCRGKGAVYTEKEIFKSNNVEDTEKIGAKIAEELDKRYPGRLHFIMLEGPLGVGKTALTRGVASVFSPGSRVKSPSYTIVNEYRLGRVPLFHFDLYRLGANADLSDIGFYEYVESGHCVVEWSEYLADVPGGAVNVSITSDGESSRKIEIIYPDRS